MSGIDYDLDKYFPILPQLKPALLIIINNIYQERDGANLSGKIWGGGILHIFLDLSEALDTIEHSILLRCLREGGVQKAVMGGYHSSPWEPSGGVPLGPILSLMLFSLHMKLLGAVIRRCRMKCHQYSDDTQLYLSVPSEQRRGS